ncbi:MAG: hypothetical protein ACREJO_04990 [Phycisphaerales bacterium]
MWSAIATPEQALNAIRTQRLFRGLAANNTDTVVVIFIARSLFEGPFPARIVLIVTWMMKRATERTAPFAQVQGET